MVIRVICWFLVVGCCSCVGIRKLEQQTQLKESNCNQQNAYTYSKEDLPAPVYEMNLDTALVNRFSFESLNVANAIGILGLLTDYVQAQKSLDTAYSVERRLEVLERGQQIQHRINIASLEISAIASEIDCEEERADQIASYLSDKESQEETRLTVGAIVVGAAGAIITGVLLSRDDNSADVVGVSVGISEALLGLAILLNKRKVMFHHHRNILQDIWLGKATSTVFPPSIWYYLNYFDPAQPEKPSLRVQIIGNWMRFGEFADARSKKRRKLIGLFFGEGGKYTSEQLKNRSGMLDQVEAHVTLMKQDLKKLSFEIENNR